MAIQALPNSIIEGMAMKFTRALTLARYNWPLYVVMGVSMLFGVAVGLSPLPLFVRVVAGIGASVAVWYAVASFSAFYMIFDRSDLLSGDWLPPLLKRQPERWVQVSVCLEETTLPMEVFPGADGVLLDLFQADVMTEPAIARARLAKQDNVATKAAPDLLPVEDDWAELVVVTLAAHEVRDEETRKQMFAELNRITAQGGEVVVVEHLRNVAALLAFGPGCYHFFPRSEWLTLGEREKWSLRAERSITPFVQVFVFSKGSQAGTPASHTLAGVAI